MCFLCSVQDGAFALVFPVFRALFKIWGGFKYSYKNSYCILENILFLSNKKCGYKYSMNKEMNKYCTTKLDFF